MKKRSTTIALLVAAIALFSVALAPGTADAHPRTRANGTLLYDEPVVQGVQPFGDNLKIDVAITGEVFGTMSGTVQEDYTVLHFGSAQVNIYFGLMHFEGTVTDAYGVDREGTLTIRTAGYQNPGAPVPTLTPWQMRWVIVGATGELAGTRGWGAGELIGLTLDYYGRIHVPRH